MKPTLAALRAACPEVDPRILQDHLSRLGDRYFSYFTYPKIHEHVVRLARISSAHPVEVMASFGPKDAVECTILAFDHPGVFSLITGVMTGLGLDILSGEVFTYARNDHRKGRRWGTGRRRDRPTVDTFMRRKIVNHFQGTLESPPSRPRWIDDLRNHLREIFVLLELGDEASREQARSRVNEMVILRLSRIEIDSVPVLYPVSLEVDNSGPENTRLRIVSEDTPAFLYALTHAFSLHDIRIEHVRIRTIGNRIEDEIDVVDRRHGKIEDPDLLGSIRLSVLLTKQFTYFLGKAPDPSTALRRFKHLVEDVLRLPGKEEWLGVLTNPTALKDLAVLLGTSDFLWEDFVRLQYETLLPVLKPLVREIPFGADHETLAERIRLALAGASTLEESRERLNRFKDQEIFLIDLDHILRGDMDFNRLSERLTRLAEAVLNTAAGIAYRHLSGTFGRPGTAAGMEAPYALLGLGKLGGMALGYASDIEILVVYGDSGFTDGDRKIPNADFFDRLVSTTAGLVRTKREGIFHVDLRMRPHGNAGPLACSLGTFCDYYGAHGQAHSYERLGLVRLRAIGGDPALGARVERIRDELVYSSRLIRLDELRALREKQLIEKTTPGKRNAKFSPGALVDIEYSVQILQALNGDRLPPVRTPRIEEALSALGDAGVISPDETSRLFSAYRFFRLLINAMRILRGSARDLVLPDESAPEFSHLARRMGYGIGKPLGPAQRLRVDYETHTAAVRAFAERHFGPEATAGAATGTVADLILSESVPGERAVRILSAAGFRDPARACTNLRILSGEGARRLAFARLSLLAMDILSQTACPDMALNNWERFIQAGTSPEFHFGLLMEQPVRLEILMKIFAGSQFLSDTLILDPGALDWIILPENLHQVRGRNRLQEELEAPAVAPAEHGRWLNRMRRFRRREILRIGTRDIVLQVPTEDIVLELSLLAEALCASALKHVLQRLPGEETLPRPRADLGERFFLLAFGKLGGRELNYSSDIDLVGAFGVPEGFAADPDSDALLTKGLFAGIMERLGKDLSQHTDEGCAYRVDLRLRPHGQAGEIVSPMTTLLDYYRHEASLWEIQAALKIRPIAGNMALGHEFLRRLRPILLQRRPRGAIVESIEKMRDAALRRHGHGLGEGLDVKSGAGGIRDVEFLAQGLQLIHAPDRPELLEPNTLSALRLLASTGILPEGTVAQLSRDYLFLRRVEHALQILEDRQIHALPGDPAELKILARRVLGAKATASSFLDAVEVCCERIRGAYTMHLLGKAA